jgi:hypothetical protein
MVSWKLVLKTLWAVVRDYMSIYMEGLMIIAKNILGLVTILAGGLLNMKQNS